jgi:hypothetical protein
MYFWKTRLLVDELAKGPLEEGTLKNYYLATSILVLVSYYLSFLGPRENLYALTAEAIVVLVATIIGLNAAFAANGGAAGSRFLDKIIALSFPLLIRVLAAGFVLGLLVAILDAAEVSKVQVEWVSSISNIAIQVVFFLRLVTHVKKTNA